jgi:hypothetical protein
LSYCGLVLSAGIFFAQLALCQFLERSLTEVIYRTCLSRRVLIEEDFAAVPGFMMWDDDDDDDVVDDDHDDVSINMHDDDDDEVLFAFTIILT